MGGVNLRGADLRKANLRGANLRMAELNEALLCDADLRDADLREEDLRLVDFSGADLRGADLSMAHLGGAYLRGADLRGADLDLAAWPLSRGGTRVTIDRRIAARLAYYFCAQECDDPDYLKARNAILDFANQFHRIEEYGELEPIPEKPAKEDEDEQADEYRRGGAVSGVGEKDPL
jgi:hypothetical protein